MRLYGGMIMKKKKLFVLLLIVIGIVICLGVGVNFVKKQKQEDTLKFLKENVSPTNTQCADYEVNIGKNTDSATIIAELWQDGVCTQSSPVILNTKTSYLHISLLMDGFGTNEGIHGLNVQIDTNERVSSMLTYFDLPSQVRGYSFTAYDNKEVIKVNAGEEHILVAMAFDLGDGVRSMDCTSLLEEPERVTSASCLLIVRATFA